MNDFGANQSTKKVNSTPLSSSKSLLSGGAKRVVKKVNPSSLAPNTPNKTTPQSVTMLQSNEIHRKPVKSKDLLSPQPYVNITADILSTPIRNNSNNQNNLNSERNLRTPTSNRRIIVSESTPLRRTPKKTPTKSPVKHFNDDESVATKSITKRSPGPLPFGDAVVKTLSTPKRITHINATNITAETLSANKAAKRQQLFRKNNNSSTNLASKPVNISKPTAASLARAKPSINRVIDMNSRTINNKINKPKSQSLLTNSNEEKEKEKERIQSNNQAYNKNNNQINNKVKNEINNRIDSQVTNQTNCQEISHQNSRDNIEIIRSHSFGSISPVLGRTNESINYITNDSSRLSNFDNSNNLTNELEKSKLILQKLVEENDQRSNISNDSITKGIGLLDCDISDVFENELCTPHSIQSMTSMLSLTQLSDYSRSQSRLGDMTTMTSPFIYNPLPIYPNNNQSIISASTSVNFELNNGMIASSIDQKEEHNNNYSIISGSSTITLELNEGMIVSSSRTSSSSIRPLDYNKEDIEEEISTKLINEPLTYEYTSDDDTNYCNDL